MWTWVFQILDVFQKAPGPTIVRVEEVPPVNREVEEHACGPAKVDPPERGSLTEVNGATEPSKEVRHAQSDDESHENGDELERTHLGLEPPMSWFTIAAA